MKSPTGRAGTRETKTQTKHARELALRKFEHDDSEPDCSHPAIEHHSSDMTEVARSMALNVWSPGL
jgi:hypothetical protein